MPYTTNDLLNDIKRDSYGGTAQGNFDAASLLKIGDEEMLLTVVPMMIRFRQNYYLDNLTGNFISGQIGYPLPEHSMFGAVKDVKRMSGGVPVPLARIQTSTLAAYGPQNFGFPTAFYLGDGNINFAPTPSNTSDQYQIWYYRRPARMVDPPLAAKVLSVNYISGEVTYTAPPPATYTASSVHDFYSSVSPFQRTGTKVTATAIAGSVQTFPAASVAALNPGDYVCLVNETVYPGLPLELQPYLKELICLRISQNSADQTAYALNKDRIAGQMAAALGVQAERSDGHPETPTLLENSMLMAIIRF